MSVAGSDALDQLEMLGLIAIAVVLGGVVGYDRDRHDKPAGIRTHALIAGASALTVALGTELVAVSGGDASRALHAVITGIGFLCAGSILRNGVEHSVSGLTTASSMFFAGAMGAAAGARELILAAGVTVLVVVVLQVGRWLGH